MKIFVFGSNLAGRHGKGAAKVALQKYGAIYGKGVGLQGQSYAIPTKNHNIITLPIETISFYIDEFKQFCINNPHLNFYVTRIGCGLAGYKDQEIAPLFTNSPENCVFDIQWRPYLGDKYKYFSDNI